MLYDPQNNFTVQKTGEYTFKVKRFIENERDSVFKIYKLRLFWLLIGLIGGLVISKFVHAFEETLQENILVATFIPLVVYISDAVGTQVESIIIRALSKQWKFKFSSFFTKQFLVVSSLGITLGVLAIFGSYIMYKQAPLSIGLGIAVTCSIISSVITGLAIPYAFWKSGQDPAEASGPIATIIQDSISVLVYFIIMTSFIV